MAYFTYNGKQCYYTESGGGTAAFIFAWQYGVLQNAADDSAIV